MIKKFRNLIVLAAMSFAVLTPALAVPVLGGVASASIQDEVCNGATSAATGAEGECTGNLSEDAAGDSIQNFASSVVDIISIVIGAIAIIFLLYGGFRYITSGGDSGKVGNAKNTILYAIIGLIIVALAQIIVNLVLGTASEAGETLVS